MISTARAFKDQGLTYNEQLQSDRENCPVLAALIGISPSECEACSRAILDIVYGDEPTGASLWLSGTWNLSGFVSSDCYESRRSWTDTWEVTQTGDTVRVELLADEYNAVLTGTVSNLTINLSGSYEEDNGITNVQQCVITVATDGKSLSGTST
jgi:hypothetical protein